MKLPKNALDLTGTHYGLLTVTRLSATRLQNAVTWECDCRCGKTTLATAGMLEVWAGPLSGGRLAVALFNRSPGDDAIAVRWADVGLAPGAAVAVRDIWGAADLGTFSADFARPVPAHATAYLVLSPAA